MTIMTTTRHDTCAGDGRGDYHEQFAALYDAFYKARDVAGEARFAAGLLCLDSPGGGDAHVLDFGCGTGSHAMAFGERGIRATGFDVSPAMITRARAKVTPKWEDRVRFEAGSFKELCAGMNGCRFDGAISMFNVLNCMDSPAEMLEQLELIAGVLAPGARFLLEVWNGAAVFADEPRPDVRRCLISDDGQREVVRITLPDLDRINQVCELRYRVLTLDRASESFEEFESLHRLRFLTPVQYRQLFELAGLTLIDEFPKGRPGIEITEHDWHIGYLVRRDP